MHKLIAGVWVGVLAGGLPCAAGSIRAAREIIYPSRYETQQAGDTVLNNAVTPGGTVPAAIQRPPIPADFTTRETGAQLDTGSIGVQRNVTISKKPVYNVRFHSGSLAQFIDGLVTVVDGVPYKAYGLVGDYYYVRNLRTREWLHFRWEEPRVQRVGDTR